MPIAQHLKLRLFLEGIETPVVSANETIQGNAPAQCNVQIPATERSHDFHPKTLVHVFYRDLYDGPSEATQVSGSEAPAASTAESILNAHQEALIAARRSLAETVLQDSGTAPQVNEDGVASRLSPASAQPDPFEDDPNDPNPSLLQRDGGSGRLGHVPEWSDDLVTQLSARAWRIFFIGEVVGYGFTKTATQRSCVLNCLDPSNYWDTCYQYKVNMGRLTGNGLANFVGAGTSLFDEFFQSSEGLLIQILKRNSKTRPELTGLLSGVVHLLERVGGVYTDGGFRGVNDYFSLAELRLHLIDMISASARDESTRRLAGRRAYNRFLRREGGRLGQVSSFREILNMINRFIFHEVYPNPIAKYDPPADQEVVRTRTQSQPVLSSVAGQRLKATLEELQVNAGVTDAVIAEARTAQSEIAELMFLESRTASGPRTFSAVPVATAALQAATTQASNNMRDFSSSAQRGATQSRQINRRDMAHLFGLASAHARIAADYFDRGQVARGSAQLEAAMIALPSIEGLEGANYTSRSRSTQLVTQSARLHSQIIRPDVWMVAPPRCNVLFPEFLSSMDYSRQFLREATRLRLTVTDEIFGSDSLLNQLYYAPDIAVEGLNRRQTRQEGGRRRNRRGRRPSLQQAAYSRRLMNHELFTGVVPIFERLNEVNVFAARTDPVSHRGAQVPYVTRAAHFQFFKHRFMARTLSLSGKFNPYIAPGFPAVVIDRYMTHDQVVKSNVRGLEMLSYLDSQYDRLAAHEQMGLPTLGTGLDEDIVKDVLRQTDGGADLGSLTTIDDIWTTLRLNTPTQMIGMVVSVTHSISQASANTQYQLQYARTHREYEESLGANAVDITAREAGETTTTYVVAAREGYPPTVGQTGSNYGEITAVQELTRTGNFMLFGTFRPNTVRGINRRVRAEVTVPVGLLQAASSYQAAEVTTMVGSETEMVQFRAYEITEKVQRGRGETVVVPFEDFVRPSWISDVWKNARIGATYLQMLGVGAITDDLVFETPSTQVPSGAANLEPQITDGDLRARNDTATAGWSKDGTGSQEADKLVTVERSIDLLIRAYSAVKHNGLDVNEFIRSYIWRPVATLTEILGSDDLEIDPETGEKIKGEMGFHSLAFGHGPMGENLRNLIPEDSVRQRILDIKTGNRDRAAELSKLDKRKEKADRVLAYVEELRNNRALLG